MESKDKGPVDQPQNRRKDQQKDQEGQEGPLALNPILKGGRILFVPLVIFSILGYLGGWISLLDYTCHFRLQYFGISLVFLLAFGAFRDQKWCLASLLCVAVNLIPLLAWYLPPQQKGVRGYHVKIMVANVYRPSTNTADFLQLVREEEPHFLVVLEVNSRWEKKLEDLKDILPYSLVVSREDNFGIGLYSAYPLTKKKVLFLGQAGVPSLLGVAQIRQRKVYLVATHPLPPFGKNYFQLRNDQLDEMGALVESLPKPTLLMGDLNTTMWSSHYKKLVARGNLENTRLGFGVLPTWPSGLGPGGIPLDHCLVSPDIQVLRCSTIKIKGSDHRGLTNEIIIPK